MGNWTSCTLMFIVSFVLAFVSPTASMLPKIYPSMLWYWDTYSMLYFKCVICIGFFHWLNIGQILIQICIHNHLCDVTMSALLLQVRRPCCWCRAWTSWAALSRSWTLWSGSMLSWWGLSCWWVYGTFFPLQYSGGEICITYLCFVNAEGIVFVCIYMLWVEQYTVFHIPYIE